MANQIVTLRTNTGSDGSFTISGVFWLPAPTGNIVPNPTFTSQVPFIDSDTLLALQLGTFVEVPFTSGQYLSGTTTTDVQSDLVARYDAAQTELMNSSVGGTAARVFDGTSWTNWTPAKPSAPIKGSPVSVGAPSQADGSPYFSPCMFPSGVFLYVTGADDTGVPFADTSEALGDEISTFSFNDWILIAGGGIIFQGAQVGDHLTFQVYCPATPVTPNLTNTGNCNVVSGVIVPAAGNGSYNVDMTLANPILTPSKNGYWEWDFPNTGRGNVAAGVPGKAGAQLVAADVPLAQFANRYQLLGSGVVDFTIPAIQPKICLPHWKIKTTLHNSGHTGLKAVWHMTTARVQTIH